MKRIFIFFVIPCLLMVHSSELQADRRGYINTVVIDPGHGGRDPGAVGRHSREKDITLAISLKLGQYINEHLPDVKVIYTRKTDEFVGLYRRAQIANENHADLFISIHCNSTRSSAAYGTETFVMGLHRSEANLEVARKENASILFEDDYMETYGGFDPHSPEANIIFSLYQNAYLEQSLSFASLVQDQFRDRAMRVDRGVKQAGFLVLYQITMPGVLVEAGFLSNPREEQYLMSETGQAHIASAIFRAFRDYKQQHDAMAAARKTLASDAPENPETAPVLVTTGEPETRQQSSRRARAEARNQDLRQVQPDNQPINSEQTAAQQPPQIEARDEAIDLHDTKQTSDHHAVTSNTPDVNFRVQIAVSSQQKPHYAPEFEGLNDLRYYFHEGLYKYTVGLFATLEEAIDMQRVMQESGFHDAFVVAFLHEERITATEAIRLISLGSSNP